MPLVQQDSHLARSTSIKRLISASCMLTDQTSSPCYCNEDIKLSLYMSCGPQFTANIFIMTVGTCSMTDVMTFSLWLSCHITVVLSVTFVRNRCLLISEKWWGAWWKSIWHSPIFSHFIFYYNIYSIWWSCSPLLRSTCLCVFKVDQYNIYMYKPVTDEDVLLSEAISLQRVLFSAVCSLFMLAIRL